MEVVVLRNLVVFASAMVDVVVQLVVVASLLALAIGMLLVSKVVDHKDCV